MWISRKICANHINATTFSLITLERITLYPYELCETHSCLWADVNCNVCCFFFFFFLHRESGMVRLNWSKLYARQLSFVGMIVPPMCNHYPSSGCSKFNASPSYYVGVVSCKRFVTVEWIARHYTLFLWHNGVLNQAILSHLVGTFCLFRAVSSGFNGARFMEMASRDLLKHLATPVNLWNLHWCQLVWKVKGGNFLFFFFLKKQLLI